MFRERKKIINILAAVQLTALQNQYFKWQQLKTTNVDTPLFMLLAFISTYIVRCTIAKVYTKTLWARANTNALPSRILNT